MAEEAVDTGKPCHNLSRNEQYCVPFGDPMDPDFWDPELNGRGIGSGLGSNPQWDAKDEARRARRCNGSMYPGLPLEKDNKAVFTVAADRSPSMFALTNHLDFRRPDRKKFRSADGTGWPNQFQLVEWYAKNKHCLAEEMPFGLDTQLIPCKIDFQTAYWCVERPIEGITFDLVEKFSGTVLKEGIDGGVRNSGKVKIPDALCWSHDENRVLQICITAMPPLVEDDCVVPDLHGYKSCGGLDNWAVMTSACVHCPDTGK